MPPAPGSTLGRYQIRSRLGGGAMGVVWLAHDPALERRVALKLISPGLADNDDFRTRFLREARAAAAIDHPHVLPVYEAGEADGQLFLAMRYVPGVDLATHLARSGPLALDAALTLVGQLASALDAAHGAGVIHRDLKPANVLLAADDHAYLADFGLARSAAAVGMTRPGQLIGTAAYTAPELLRGEPASPASDTYALACLAVECLTGQPPFSAADEMATLYAHAHTPPPTLVERRPELPSGLQAVIERGLAKDPAGRYASAAAFAADLRAGAAGAGAGAAGVDVSKGATERAHEQQVPRTRWLVAAGAVAALVVAVGAAFIIGEDPLRDAAEHESASASASALTTVPESAPAVTAITSAEIEASAEHRVALDPGEYELPEVRPPMTFELRSGGWDIDRVYPDGFNLNLRLGKLGGSYLSGGVVQVVLDGPCLESPTQAIDADPAALVAWLGANQWLDVTDPVPVNLGGWSGLQVDVGQTGNPAGSCGPAPSDVPPEIAEKMKERVYIFLLGSDDFWIAPDERVRLLVVDVSGKSFTILAGVEDSAVFEDFIQTMEPILESIEFTTP